MLTLSNPQEFFNIHKGEKSFIDAVSDGNFDMRMFIASYGFKADYALAKDMIAMAAPRIETIVGHVTLTTAQQWQRADEQYLYCIDYLEISAHQDFADAWVDALENRFEELLK